MRLLCTLPTPAAHTRTSGTALEPTRHEQHPGRGSTRCGTPLPQNVGLIAAEGPTVCLMHAPQSIIRDIGRSSRGEQAKKIGARLIFSNILRVLVHFSRWHPKEPPR